MWCFDRNGRGRVFVVVERDLYIIGRWRSLIKWHTLTCNCKHFEQVNPLPLLLFNNDFNEIENTRRQNSVGVGNEVLRITFLIIV